MEVFVIDQLDCYELHRLRSQRRGVSQEKFRDRRIGELRSGQSGWVVRGEELQQQIVGDSPDRPLYQQRGIGRCVRARRPVQRPTQPFGPERMQPVQRLEQEDRVPLLHSVLVLKTNV